MLTNDDLVELAKGMHAATPAAVKAMAEELLELRNEHAEIRTALAKYTRTLPAVQPRFVTGPKRDGGRTPPGVL